jgi:hypothetical protein
MAEIHCHRCGGFIVNPAGTTYLPPSEMTPPATPHTRLCTCERAVIYGAPPGYMSSPGLPAPRIHILRSASRN